MDELIEEYSKLRNENAGLTDRVGTSNRLHKGGYSDLFSI